MNSVRKLVIVADDFGIGPETDRGILDVALAGRLSATVLLVNTKYTEDALRSWRRTGCPMAIGWHPNLTLDTPVLPPDRVPSLVQADGRFWSLGQFLLRSRTGRLNKLEVAAELAAQHQRFIELVGHPPMMVNSHQHVAIFSPVGEALIEILANQSGPKPYLRRVAEEHRLIFSIRGARIKRTVLNSFGRRMSRKAAERGLHSAEWLIGVTDPPITADPMFYTRWLKKVRGDVVEIGCHPGYIDETLLVRDVPGKPHDLPRRENELKMMLSQEFLQAIEESHFRIAPINEFQAERLGHAA